MTDKPRNWQEDMKLCQKATRGPWREFQDSDGHSIGTVDIHPQLKAHAPVVTLATSVRGKSIYISQNDSNFIIAAREALPYWLQQYAALEREYERFQKAAIGWNDDLTKAEAEIEQKDAEINRLKSQLEEKSRSIKVEDL